MEDLGHQKKTPILQPVEKYVLNVANYNLSIKFLKHYSICSYYPNYNMRFSSKRERHYIINLFK